MVRKTDEFLIKGVEAINEGLGVKTRFRTSFDYFHQCPEITDKLV